MNKPSKVPVIDSKGKVVGSQVLPDSLFASFYNEVVLTNYLRVFQMRSRKNSLNKVQSRSDVTGTTAKVWRQKGTGRARHGSRKAPIFVGGGQAHGPAGNRNYSLNIPKTQKIQALLTALRSQAGNVVVLQDAVKATNKTKDLSLMLKNGFDWQGERVLLILDQPYDTLIKASANLEGVKPTQAARLNPHEVFSANKLVITTEAMSYLVDKFSPDELELETDKEEK